MKKLFKPPRKRRAFTPALRPRWSASGKTLAGVARELDLTETSLRAWVKQIAVDELPDPQCPLTTEERAELTRLRRELRAVEQERDFLRATAIRARKQS